MKFTVERAVLIKALAHVQSVVERRNTIPILANVLLAAQDNSLRLTATDMEIAVVEEVPGVRVARPGRTTAPAATLYEIVRKLPEGALVELEQGGGEAPLKLARRALPYRSRGAAGGGLPFHDGGQAAAPLHPRRGGRCATSWTAPASPSRRKRRAIT